MSWKYLARNYEMCYLDTGVSYGLPVSAETPSPDAQKLPVAWRIPGLNI
jgi:hypothetical protein